MKTVLAFASALVLSGVLIAAGSIVPMSQPGPQGQDDYQEECTNEGCNQEEVEELYESYDEECLHEGCSAEEVFELGGSTQGVRDMQAAFERMGKRIDPDDFRGVDPFCAGTKTKCVGVLFFCHDQCVYPDGSKSGWYLCGGCFGFKW